MLSAILGSIAIAPPGSAHPINLLPANNPSTPVLTQPSSMLAQSAVAQRSTSILYVNSSDGRDTGNGSDRTPFKTITQALKVAQSGTTILLAPGTYSTETGEIFPLVLKAGVTLQGDPATRGQEILIQGSGASTRKALGQSLTIEITAPATLNGVTVSNPNPQGYGAGIDSSNPLISNSTFTDNSYGLVIIGDSAAQIQNNYFYQNRTAGIGVAGIAQPSIQDNIFEQTGSAVIVGDRAAPLIANNRMTQNQNGMVFQGSAQPTVRNNSVEGNRQNGLLAKDTSRPDLGTVANPGGNFFRNNGLSDVNVSATDQLISAVGNEWLNAVGTLNTTLIMPASSNSAASFPTPSALSANSSSEPPRPMQIVQIAMPSTPHNQAPSLQAAGSIQMSESSQPAPQPVSVAPGRGNSLPLISPPITKSLAVNPLSQPLPKAQTSSAIALPLSGVPQNGGTVPLVETFPLPPSSSQQVIRPTILAKPATLKPVQRNQLTLLSPIAPIPISIPVPPHETPITPTPIAPTPISIPVPPPETITLRPHVEIKPTRSIQVMIKPQKAARSASATLLPVPSSNIPLGKIGEMPSVYSMRGMFQPSPMQNPIPFSNDPKGSSIRFRVVVNARQEAEQAQVLALVPDAFVMASHNKRVMQVGAFSDRTKAEQLTQMLANQGISSTIEPINQ
jgi:parallel beta-helix repeat protein